MSNGVSEKKISATPPRARSMIPQFAALRRGTYRESAEMQGEMMDFVCTSMCKQHG